MENQAMHQTRKEERTEERNAHHICHPGEPGWGEEGKDARGLVLENMSGATQGMLRKERRQNAKRGKWESGRRGGPFVC